MMAFSKTARLLLLLLMVNLHLIAQSVGIGTNSPNASAQLEIASTTKGMLLPRMTFAQRSAITTPATGLLVYQTDLISGFYYFNGTAWTPVSAGSSQWSTSGSDIFSNNSGNVGIGISTPGSKLHIKGIPTVEANTASSGSIMRMYGGTAGLTGIFFYEDIATPAVKGFIGINHGTSGYAQWAYNSSNLTLDDQGVGISNTTPLTKLHVLGTQDAGMGVGSNGYLMLGPGTGQNLIIDNNEIISRNNSGSADLFLQNDAGNVILCANELGGVGIGVIAGTSIPAGYLLAVDGKIISEELKVQLSGNWPDYVFNKSYQLLPIKNLEQFISTNKHLPNIPAATVMEKNGIEVGEMQRKMMEKIEELTLYIIDLQKQIDVMQAKLKSINK